MNPTNWWRLPQPLRAPEVGGSGGGDSDGGGQGEQFWTKFDLPDGMKGGNTSEEAFGKLYEGWKGARDKIASFAPPKDAAGYSYSPSDTLKPWFSKSDDPWMQITRNAALKTGMPVKMYGDFLGEMFGAAHGKGLLPKLYNPEEQIAAVGKTMFADLTGNEQKQAVNRAITDASAFAPVLGDFLKLSDAGKAELTGLADFAGGVEMLHKVKALLKERGIELGGQSRNQAYSKEDYDRDVNDDRYQPFSPKYDAQWRASVDEKARQLFGR